MIDFTNTYAKLPENFFERIRPERFAGPELIVFNEELASLLGIDFTGVSQRELAEVFAGQRILPGSEPMALVYAGYQFGHLVPQLGDGRAHLLGEVKGFDLQLKGSGRTRFSRRGDGRSALGPVLREYIVSESMHALGVPTTRSLCAVTTGEEVLRQNGPEPGGILTRVAASHLRVGTFQYFAFRSDKESLRVLLDYTIQRHYPELQGLEGPEKVIALLKAFILKQADLVALWSGLGFIHGVMNTDNFSLAGITIDYGPCAFLDEFKFDKVFSSIDEHGRYSFFNQVPIAKWNVVRLAETLLPLIDADEARAIKRLEDEVLGGLSIFDEKRMNHFARKLGIQDYKKSDDDLILKFLHYLEDESLDFTLAFRNLPKLYEGSEVFYPRTEALVEFLAAWRDRVSSVSHLDSLNPVFIPRNHLIQKVIEDAYAGDFSSFHALLTVTSKPFETREEYARYAVGPKEEERVSKTFCGT